MVTDPAPRPDPGDRHHYGGEHHRLSLIDWLGGRVEENLDEPSTGRDPALLRRLLPVLDAFGTYFATEVRHFDRIPHEPVMIVGNHSGGVYMPDYWALLRAWVRERGPDAPLYSLGFDFLFSVPGFGELARRIGVVPASHQNAGRLVAQGASLLVYPGGDEEDYRPWRERHLIDLRGRMGFVRLALRSGVPVVPVVAHGSHEAMVVLTRGQGIATRLGFDRLRINIFPLVASVPWGIVPIMPSWPIPTKVTVDVCEPLDWSRFGPGAAEDPEVVAQCYEEISDRMQAALDELVDEMPHPIVTRLLNPLNRGRR